MDFQNKLRRSCIDSVIVSSLLGLGLDAFAVVLDSYISEGTILPFWFGVLLVS